VSPHLADGLGLEAMGGGEVEVRNLYTGDWCRGFAVVETAADRCLLRRLSDGTVLPVPVPLTEVRPFTGPGAMPQPGRLW
jgi:hypothetical protein